MPRQETLLNTGERMAAERKRTAVPESPRTYEYTEARSAAKENDVGSVRDCASVPRSVWNRDIKKPLRAASSSSFKDKERAMRWRKTDKFYAPAAERRGFERCEKPSSTRRIRWLRRTCRHRHAQGDQVHGNTDRKAVQLDSE